MMTNFEYYLDDIVYCIKGGFRFAVDKKMRKTIPCLPPGTCSDSYCKRCMFGGDCSSQAMKKWLKKKHINQEWPTLTVCQFEILKKLVPEWKWVKRNNGTISFYKEEPVEQKNKLWGSKNSESEIEVKVLPIELDDFDFIKRDPWSVEDILENCEVRG